MTEPIYSAQAPIPLRMLIAWPQELARSVEYALLSLKRNQQLTSTCVSLSGLEQYLRRPGYYHILVTTPQQFEQYLPVEQERLGKLVSLFILGPGGTGHEQAKEWLAPVQAGIAFATPLDKDKTIDFIYHLCAGLVAKQSVGTAAANAWHQVSEVSEKFYLHLAKADEAIWPAKAVVHSQVPPTQTQTSPPPSSISGTAVSIDRADINTFIKLEGGQVNIYSPSDTIPKDNRAKSRVKEILFVLKIFQFNGQLYKQVLLSDRDQTNPEPFLPPFSEQAWPAVLKALRTPLGVLRPGLFYPDQRQALLDEGLLAEPGDQNQQSDILLPTLYRHVGQRLYDALFPPQSSAKAYFETTLTRAQREILAVTFRLVFNQDATIVATYPWELLYHDNRFLVRANEVDIIRYIAFDRAQPQFELYPPLRILFVAARPADQTKLPLLAERQAVIAGLLPQVENRQVIFDVLSPPTRANLISSLTPGAYDGIHFDGHGTFGFCCPTCRVDYTPVTKACTQCGYPFEDISPSGALLFEDERGKTDYVDAEQLVSIFGKSRVQFVILSACQSGRVGGEVLFGGAGPALIQAGIPAVVSMQLPISVDEAIKFVRQFYTTFAQGDPISEAVRRGRQQIGRTNPESWFIPTLYLRNVEGEKPIRLNLT